MAHNIKYDYLETGTSEDFNNINYQIVPTGFYNNVFLTKITDLEVSISTFTAFISDHTNELAVRIENDAVETGIAIDSINSYIVARINWVNSIANDFTLVKTTFASIQSGDLIVGQGVFSGATLTGFNYDLQSQSILKDNGGTLNGRINDYQKFSIASSNHTLQLNGNNPPTVKTNTKFSFYSKYDSPVTGEESVYRIYELADRTFAWNSGNFPVQSNGTWYIYIAEPDSFTVNISTGNTSYGASKNVPSYDFERQGWYNSDGYVLASFDSTGGTVDNLVIYEEDRIISTENPSITPGRKGQLYFNTSTEVVFVSIDNSTSADWAVITSGSKVVVQTDDNLVLATNDGIDIVEVDSTTYSPAVTLPPAVGNTGRVVTVKIVTHVEEVFVQGTIDGETDFYMNNVGDYVTLYCNGTEWKKIGFIASYITGSDSYINRTDWTNVHLGSNATLNTDSNVTHNLGVSEDRLEVRIFLAEDASGTNAFEIGNGNTRTADLGETVFNVDNNNITVQTGSDGTIALDTSGNTNTIITDNLDYKITVYRKR